MASDRGILKASDKLGSSIDDSYIPELNVFFYQKIGILNAKTINLPKSKDNTHRSASFV